ncbi:cupin domain-containing protein [Acetobacter musti]|uniref:Cupin domain-containing protein n=1 Tax=Acetobacter musti TaxID=864732 RepID=A0ABX0JRY7_9PROT|nr:cupin domain-containing protein [Acetobacter musti]NHN85558.1 cupin domain-containing protein [Acetobacter musti]
MKASLTLAAALTALAAPAEAQHLSPADVPAIHPTKESTLQELLGQNAGLRSDRMSIALFTLAPGSAYPASHNITSEEVFLIRSGTGTVWLNATPTKVAPGDLIRIPAGIDHKIEASRQGPLSFYAISAPPFRSDDTVPAR